MAVDHSSKHLRRLHPHLHLIVSEASQDQRHNLLLQVLVACGGAAKKYKVVEDNCLEEVQCSKASPPTSELRGGLNSGKCRGEGEEGERDP